MGREAHCVCQCGNEQGTVHALLESRDIILRGDLRRRLPIDTLTDLRAAADGLHFTSGAEAVCLHLDAPEAAAWARKITTPPPSLRDKLGIRPDTKAVLFGDLQVPEIEAALAGSRTAAAADAELAIALVADADDLAGALRAHRKLRAGVPLWIVHPKGRGVPFGETAVRTALRGAGYIDTKVAAVSARFTATRYMHAS
jgi:hypothetical protein